MSTDIENFDWSKIGPTDAQRQQSRAMLEAGETFPQIRLALAKQGLSAEYTEQLIDEVGAELILSKVVSYRAQKKIDEQLMGRGLTKSESLRVTKFAYKTYLKHSLQWGYLKKATLGLSIAAGVLFVIGLLILVLHETSIVPTFFALGPILMTTGFNLFACAKITDFLTPSRHKVMNVGVR